MENFAIQTYFSGPLSALRMVPETEKEESAIYRSLIYYCSTIQLKKYDYIINETIKTLLCGEYVKDGGSVVEVYDVIVDFPSYITGVSTESKETKKILMRPHMARSLEENYMCRVYVLCKNYKKGDRSDYSLSKEFIGFLPCMVGSSRCITGVKPKDIPTLEEWKFSLGEGIPPGYFIRNGHNVSMLLTVKQSTHTVFVVKTQKGRIVTRMTELYRGKTTVFRIVDGKRTSAVKVLSPHIPMKNQKEKSYPLFLVYYILMGNRRKFFDTKKISNFIASFAPKEERKYIMAYLRTSIDKFERISTPKAKIDDLLTEYIVKKNSRDGDEKGSRDRFTLNGIYNILMNEMSPADKEISSKIANFSFVVCEHIRTCIGTRPLDVLDHCAKKKLDDFSRLLEQNINKFLKPRITSKKDQDINKWTIGGKDENLVELLKGDSYPLIRSTYDKINVTADERNKSFSIRQVQTTGYGVICPVNTSEGKKCGMTGNISICTRISWNSEYISGLRETIYSFRDEDQYISLIEKEDYFPIFYEKEGVYVHLKTSEGELYVTEEFVEFLKYSFERMKKDIPNEVKFEIYDRIVQLNNEEEIDRKNIIYEYKQGYLPVFLNNGSRMKNEESLFYVKEKYAPNGSIVEGTRVDIILDKISSKGNPISIQTNFGKFEITTAKNVSLIFKFCFKSINRYCSTVSSTQNDHIFIANSTVLCYNEEAKVYPTILWFNSKLVVPKIKEYIRNGKLPIDTCVYTNNGKIYFCYDSGRMMSPFLVVDEDGDLAMDKNNYIEKNWGRNEVIDYSKVESKIEEMFKLGLIEYVDARYLDTTFIAETVTECRRFSKLRKILNSVDIENSDSSFYQKDGIYFNEDITYVNIDKKKYNVIFTEDQQLDNQLKVTLKGKNGNFDVYAYYKIPYDIYERFSKEIILLKNDKKATKRDGFLLGYISEENKFEWIYDGVDMDQEFYNDRKILFVKFKKGENVKKVYIDGEFLIEIDAIEIENIGKKYFIFEGDDIIWKDVNYSNGKSYNFLNDEELGVHYYVKTTGELSVPITSDMDYEKFNIEMEKLYYDKLIERNPTNDRESDFLMTFRRNQHHLDELDISKLEEPGYASYVFEFLRSRYEQFKKKSNIYKIMRYLNWKFKFTHCPIDPNMIYCAAAGFLVRGHQDQGPRLTYQCQMIKQSLSITNPIYYAIFETGVKRAMKTEQHLVEPVAEEPLYGVTISSSVNPMTATVVDYGGFEDALTVSESFHFRYEKPSIVKVTEKDDTSGKSSEYVSFPKNQDGNEKVDEKYRHLGPDGLPRIGSVIEVGDCICGMMRYNNLTKTFHDISIDAKYGQEGVVVQIKKTCTEDSTNTRHIEIKICSRRDSKLGAKVAGIHAQKGTIGHIETEDDRKGFNLKIPGFYASGGNFEFLEGILPEEIIEKVASGELRYKVVDDIYMPRTASGIAIDVIFSPFSYPSRMTMGMNYEKLAGKAALRLQKKVDGSMFHKNQTLFFEEVLMKNGKDRHGCEILIHADGEVIMDVTTGKPLRVYVCPCGYKKLRHDVEDKISIRFKGKRDPVTDQGTHGRPEGGAQRFGEMEKDALCSHRAAGLALDRLMYGSDVYKAVFCKHCGRATSESDVIKKVCKICKTPNSLVIMVQTRIFRIISQYLEPTGICIKMKVDKKKEHEIV